MRITNVKYRNGLSTGQDVAVNRANLASAQEQLTAVESAQRDSIRALQVLLGRYPDAALELNMVEFKLSFTENEYQMGT